MANGWILQLAIGSEYGRVCYYRNFIMKVLLEKKPVPHFIVSDLAFTELDIKAATSAVVMNKTFIHCLNYILDYSHAHL